VFVQIQFKKQDSYNWHHVYASESAWAEYIEKALRYSGYEIVRITGGQDPWRHHLSSSSLWVQRDADGNAVAMMDTEETNDMVYHAARFMGSSRFGDRQSVERPVAQKIEDY
jgi:hypothetical protein